MKPSRGHLAAYLFFCFSLLLAWCPSGPAQGFPDSSGHAQNVIQSIHRSLALSRPVAALNLWQDANVELQQEAQKEFQVWTQAYEARLDALLEAEARLQRFHELKQSIEQLQALAGRLEAEQFSLHQLFARQVRTVPMSVAVLAWTRPQPEMELDQAKRSLTRLAGRFLPLTLETHPMWEKPLSPDADGDRSLLADARVAMARQAASEPQWYSAASGDLFQLGVWRVYPDFGKEPEAMGEKMGRNPDMASAGSLAADVNILVLNPRSNPGVPQSYAPPLAKKKIRFALDLSARLNQASRGLLQNMQEQYNQALEGVGTRLRYATASLEKQRAELTAGFGDAGPEPLAVAIESARRDLDAHVQKRHFMVVAQAEGTAHGDWQKEEVFRVLSKNAYEQGMEWARIQQNLSFVVVPESGPELVDGKSYYSAPVAVGYRTPARLELAVLNDRGDKTGEIRCGVLLGLEISLAAVGQEPVRQAILTGPDLVNPQVAIRNVRPDYYAGESLLYAVEASDDRGLALLRFSVADTAVSETFAVSGTKVIRPSAVNTRYLSPGTYAYEAVATDAAGNTSHAEGVFTLHAQPPPKP